MIAGRGFCVVLASVAVLLGGCERPGPTSSSAGKTAPAARPAMEAASTAFHQALRTNDAEALFAYVAEDVVMMPPGEAPVRGKAAMRAWYGLFLSQFRTTALTLADREVIVGEGWAVEMGSYQWGLGLVAGGEPVVDRGHYMQVWKSEPDGQWRFAREIWNSSVVPPEPSPK